VKVAFSAGRGMMNLEKLKEPSSGR